MDPVQKTFVLAYPCHHIQQSVGAIVTECMDVSENFARKHLINIGWDADADVDAWDDAIPSGKWDYYLTSRPVTAMIVEGKGCFRQVKKLISQNKFPFWIDGNLTVYTSDSSKQAEKDFDLWFCSVDWKEVVKSSERVVCVRPDEVHGPVDQVLDFIKRDPLRDVKKELRENFLLEYMCFFFIKPLAFRKHCVGKVLSAIEANCSSITGLKLVPTTGGDEYGVAVIAFDVESNLIIKHQNPSIMPNDCNGVFEIGSDYIQQNEPGQEVLKEASLFFESGFTVWAYPYSIGLGGCMFEASLVGLASMQ
ncbi:hypothetical protein MKW94_030507 [Papaver nudicaule]|uniref:Uncharacterized protein n=1 Tax=Papaver nudicaule TaxID=74823 RepID=A0AA41W0U4_PAPNU|nr:hypothetical protein [Papaver nudicaule]